MGLVRIIENRDWVVGVLLASVLVMIVVLQYLQRERGLKGFFTAAYSDSGNIFPTWILISVVYVLLLSTLFTSYVPMVPLEIERLSLFGFSLNRFGYTLLVFSLFYFSRFFLTFFFYSSVGQDRKWGRLYFVTSKFYMALCFVLIGAVVLNYYFLVERLEFLQVTLLVAVGLFLFKILFYAFNPNYILPKEWYYKILYICTLQFIPILALWKLLFL